MNTRKVQAFVLRYLRPRDGTPATEELLLMSIAGVFGEELTETEAKAVLSDMVTADLLSAATHPILRERSYTLTTSGQHAANQLR